MRALNRHPDELQLSLYAGEDLNFLNRWRVARHVKNCRQCEAAVMAHSRVRTELLAQPPVPEPDFEALAHRIRVEAEHVKRAGTRDRGWRWAVAGAGAAAAAVAIALLLPVGSPELPGSRRAALETIPPPAEVALLYEGADVQVTREGALSVRSYHPGSGVLTVTEYFAP